MKKITSLQDLEKIADSVPGTHPRTRVIVGLGTCGIAAGAKAVVEAVIRAAEEMNLDVDVVRTGCIGMCEQEPLLDIQEAGSRQRITYGTVTPELARQIMETHVGQGRVLESAAIARLEGGDC